MISSDPLPISRVDTVRHGFCSTFVRMTGLVSYYTKKNFHIFVHQFSRYRGFPTKIAHFYFSVQKTLILSLWIDVYSEWPASRGTLKSQLHSCNNTFCPVSPGQNIFHREWLVTNSKFSKIEKCHDQWHWHVNVSEE